VKIKPNDFNEFSSACKYGEFGLKEYSRSEFEWTCRNKHNLTFSGSWGNCNYNDCPLREHECVGALYIREIWLKMMHKII